MSDSKAVDTRSMTLEPSDTEPSKGSGKSTYLPGEFIHERYEVVKLLGKGSNGTVYQVKDHKVGTTVAVKLICASARNESGAASRLHHEIRIAYSVKSDYITNLYSMFSDDHHIGLVLEYVNGQSLYSYLQAHTVFTIRDVINIGRQIALGLQRIHCAGIIHRDLKLENILLDESGMAKITDFGVSILQSSLIEEVPSEEISPDQLKRRATEAGKVVGTLHYLSPEYLSKRIFDVRTDIYALGVVLYELTTC
ncbi:MAG: serine/threonine protein kinase, partial [Bdellovibrionales bacterium]|nr:serine/threonine protein kinase [Bdellovibrionales bacterium]